MITEWSLKRKQHKQKAAGASETTDEQNNKRKETEMKVRNQTQICESQEKSRQMCARWDSMERLKPFCKCLLIIHHILLSLDWLLFSQDSCHEVTHSDKFIRVAEMNKTFTDSV